MRRRTRLAKRALAGAAIFGLLVDPTVTLAQQRPVGVNAAVHNDVKIRRGSAAPRAAAVRERVILNDEVRTGAASQLQILLIDRSTFTVGANARVAIDRFVYDGNSRNVGVNVVQGAFRFMSGRTLRKPAGPVAIRTPVASIGIRGTIFEGVVGADAVRIALAELAVGKVANDPKTATLVLLRGPGPRAQGDAKPGAIDVTVGSRTFVLDRPNWAIYIPGPALPPVGPFEISSGGLSSFQALLRTLPLAPGAMAKPGESSWPGSVGTGSVPSDGGALGGGGAGRTHLGRAGAWLGAVILGIIGAISIGSDKDLPASP